MKRTMKVFASFLLIFALVILPMCASAASTGYVVKVNAKNVRLRSKPNTGSGYYVIKTLSKGDYLIWTGEKKGQMCQVLTTGGQKGWVYADYLTKLSSFKTKNLKYTNTSCTLYKNLTTMKKKATLASGKYVLVSSTSGTYSYVTTTSGSKGYVKTSFLSKAL